VIVIGLDDTSTAGVLHLLYDEIRRGRQRPVGWDQEQDLGDGGPVRRLPVPDLHWSDQSGDREGCVSAIRNAGGTLVSMGSNDRGTNAPTPVIACSLGPDDVTARVADWRTMLEHVSGRRAIPAGVRLELDPGARLDEIARLAAAEHECCAFLSFTITMDERGHALEVTGPPDAEPIIAELFGAP
jgi:hypothetical protein